MNKTCNKCTNCKNLQKSVYMKLQDETLYNVWCKVGNMEDKHCSSFEEKVIKSNID